MRKISAAEGCAFRMCAEGLEDRKMRKTGWVLLLVGALLLPLGTAGAEHTEHTFGSWRTKRSATCTQTGLQFRYCTGCDHWEKRELDKLPHTADKWVVVLEPTCTAEGRMEAHCTVCGTLMRKAIEKVPHQYGEEEVIREATCLQEGKGQFTCEICGARSSVKIDPLGHDWKKTGVSQAATCQDYGSYEEACLRCEKTQTERVDKLEHDFTEWTVIKEPSGQTKGTRERVCTSCGEKFSERFFWEGTLYQDMTPCEEVIRLQEMLRDLGYYSGSIRSGQFGSVTGSAVAKFQKANGLKATQVADSETLARIEEAWKALGLETPEAEEAQAGH